MGLFERIGQREGLGGHFPRIPIRSGHVRQGCGVAATPDSPFVIAF